MMPQSDFLEDFQKSEKDPSNLHPAGHKYASRYQHFPMERELSLFLNTLEKNEVSNIDSIFRYVYSKSPSE